MDNFLLIEDVVATRKSQALIASIAIKSDAGNVSSVITIKCSRLCNTSKEASPTEQYTINTK